MGVAYMYSSSFFTLIHHSIDPTGEFFRHRSSLNCFGSQARSGEALIRAEMNAVRKESLKKVEKLRFATDIHCGLEILHTFVLDLLGRGTPAAKIFLTKSEEENAFCSYHFLY